MILENLKTIPMAMRQLKISKSITTRDEACVEKYLREMSEKPTLTPEQETMLAEKIHKGDKAALDKLVEGNLRFVVSVAKQYQGLKGLKLSDLINEGNIGLIRAAEQYDPTRGFKFISYAVWWIRQSILQAINEKSRIVRIPLNKNGLINKVEKTVQKLEQRLERSPSPEELAESVEISTEEVSMILGLGMNHSSLDAELGNDGNHPLTLLDYIENENDKLDPDLTVESQQEEVIRVLRTVLNDRQYDVLTCLFGIGKKYPMSLEEIGYKYDLTRERVRQIKNKALQKLKQPKHCQLLKAYL